MLSVFLLLAIMLSVFLRFTYSDYPFVIFKLFLEKTVGGAIKNGPPSREKKDRQHNGQKKKDRQHNGQKKKDRQKHTKKQEQQRIH
jgi:hypothetical protein